MMRYCIIAAAISLLVVCAEAQTTVTLPSGARVSIGPKSPSVEAAPGNTPGGLTPDTIFEIKLLTPINSGKDKPGKKITAVTTQKVVSGDVTIVPLNSKLTGHVTEVQKRDKAHPEARLGFVFDQIQLKHGKTLVFAGVLDNVSGEWDWGIHQDPNDSWGFRWLDNGNWPDVVALSQYRYDRDKGPGVLILSQTQDIQLGYHVTLTVKVVPSQP